MNQVICWACDISKNTGEGNLANLFVKKSLRNNIFNNHPQTAIKITLK
jgi:hypothetical protein